MILTILALFVGAYCLTFTPDAFANDSTFGGAGGTLAPLKETRIRMASEHITLEARTSDLWTVQAEYVFENVTSESVTVQMGFPELGCMGDCDMEHPFTMNGLITTVRGQKIAHRTGRIDPSNKPNWAPRLGLIHLFDVTFEPNEKIAVEHRYSHAASTSVDGHSVTYLTRTGAFWNGPILDARFTIKHRLEHYYTTYPKDFTLVERKEVMTKGGPQWIYQFAMKSWQPKSDLDVFFGNPVERLPQGCPMSYHVENAWRRALQESKELTEDKLVEMVANEFFTSVTTPVLNLCRHFPYAVHGKPFEDPALNEYFYAASTEKKCAGCDPNDGMPKETMHFYHQVNPTYSDALLDKNDLLYSRMANLIYARRSTPDVSEENKASKTAPKTVK